MRRHLADRFTAILDANVLYPFMVRDVLLTYARVGMYRARWTEEITTEWSDAVLKKKPHLSENIERTKKIMREQFPESIVDGYQSIVPSITLPDPNDRHVLAAAIKVGAHVIITENLSDFPSSILEPFGIEAQSADSFLLSVFELYPDEGIAALQQIRKRCVAPPYTGDEFVLALIRVGLVLFAAEIKPRSNLI